MDDAKFKPAGWPVLISRISVNDPAALVSFIKNVLGAIGDFNSCHAFIDRSEVACA